MATRRPLPRQLDPSNWSVDADTSSSTIGHIPESRCQGGHEHIIETNRTPIVRAPEHEYFNSTHRPTNRYDNSTPLLSDNTSRVEISPSWLSNLTSRRDEWTRASKDDQIRAVTSPRRPLPRHFSDNESINVIDPTRSTVNEVATVSTHRHNESLNIVSERMQSRFMAANNRIESPLNTPIRYSYERAISSFSSPAYSSSSLSSTPRNTYTSSMTPERRNLPQSNPDTPTTVATTSVSTPSAVRMASLESNESTSSSLSSTPQSRFSSGAIASTRNLSQSNPDTPTTVATSVRTPSAVRMASLEFNESTSSSLSSTPQSRFTPSTSTLALSETDTHKTVATSSESLMAAQDSYESARKTDDRKDEQSNDATDGGVSTTLSPVHSAFHSTATPVEENTDQEESVVDTPSARLLSSQPPRVSASEQREQLYEFRHEMRRVFTDVDEMVDMHRDLFKLDPVSGLPRRLEPTRSVDVINFTENTFTQLADLRKRFEIMVQSWGEQPRTTSPSRRTQGRMSEESSSLIVLDTKSDCEEDREHENEAEFIVDCPSSPTVEPTSPRPPLSPSSPSLEDEDVRDHHRQTIINSTSPRRLPPSLSALLDNEDEQLRRSISFQSTNSEECRSPTSPAYHCIDLPTKDSKSTFRRQSTKSRENVFDDFDRRMEEIRTSLNTMNTMTRLEDTDTAAKSVSGLSRAVKRAEVTTEARIARTRATNENDVNRGNYRYHEKETKYGTNRDDFRESFRTSRDHSERLRQLLHDLNK